jgi:hypothetical protein
VTACEESEKIDQDRMKQMAMAVRMGHYADQGDWKKFLE